MCCKCPERPGLCSTYCFQRYHQRMRPEMYQTRLPTITLSSAIRLRRRQIFDRRDHSDSYSSVDFPPVSSDTSSSSEPDAGSSSELPVRSESSSLSEPQAGPSGAQPPVLRKQPSPSKLVCRTRGKMPAKKN